MNERGLTIAEVLVTVVVIAVGFVAIASGMHVASAGVAGGQQQTAAAFLAEQRLEDVKAFALSAEAAQGWSNLASLAGGESYGSIAGYPGYRRTTEISTPAGSLTQKLATVSVFWKPVGAASTQAERSVTISFLLAARS